MANPWIDPDYARRWEERITSGGGPFRVQPLDVLCRLAAVGEPARILELGIGTGLVTERLRTHLPNAEIVGLDASRAMLDLAAERLPGVRLVESDLREDWTRHAEGGFDLVVSAQSVHHVEGAGKRDVYERAFSVLRAGGRLLLADRLAVEPELFAHHVALWQRTREKLGLEPLPPAWNHADYLARLAEAGDVPDLLQTQLNWLNEVGFQPVTTFWQDGDRAVFGGVRR